MMKCTDIQKYLDDFLDDEMSLGEQKAVEAHMKTCADCQQAMEAHEAVRQTLRSLPVDEASLEFEEKMFAAVRSHYGIRSRLFGNRFVAGFATAMVASLTVWFASTMYISQLDTEVAQTIKPQMINLAMHQARTVKLVFDAPTDLADVTLSVQLPKNVELEGYAGQKQLVWQTKLNKGTNILALPVIAINSGEGQLVAQLNYGNKTKQFHIVLKSTSDGALIYQINKLKSA